MKNFIGSFQRARNEKKEMGRVVKKVSERECTK
jgi:hypothetical protein